MSAPANDLAAAEVAKARLDAIGIAVRAGSLTPSPELETEVRTLLALPAMPASVRDSWTADKNIRLPITLAQGSAAAAPNSGAPSTETPP